MLYNVVCYGIEGRQPIEIVRGYDGRPLRFTEMKYAEATAEDLRRSALEKNIPFMYCVEKDNQSV